MRTLIVYDSEFGNTEKIAIAMGQAVGADIKRPVFGEITSAGLCEHDLLIIGSPTQDGKPLTTIKILLESIPEGGLKGKKVAAFDTRHKWKFVKIWGYAAPHIEGMLRVKGGDIIVPPESFFVTTTKGPLITGELERAVEWAKTLAKKASS